MRKLPRWRWVWPGRPKKLATTRWDVGHGGYVKCTGSSDLSLAQTSITSSGMATISTYGLLA